MNFSLKIFSEILLNQIHSECGAIIEALSMLWMSGIANPGLHAHMAHSGIIIGLCMIGIGLGLFQTPNNNSIIGAVPTKKLGVASAMIATVRNLGFVMGAGLVTEIFYMKAKISGDFLSALKFTFLIAGLIAICAAIASFGKPKGPYWKKNNGLET